MKKIAISINPTKDKDNKILNMVKEKFSKKFIVEDINIFNSFDADKTDLDNDIELIIVLGGDGTLLNVAREMNKKYSIPLFGINIGSLGFLSSTELNSIDDAIEKLSNNQYSIDKRIMLTSRINQDSQSYIDDAFNDVVIARGTLSRMVKFRIYIDNKLYTSFRGDGLIIATPTGSTAYSFSAGGPFIYPNLDLIMLTPICPHTKSMQTMVVSRDSLIEVIAENDEEEIYLTVDGQKAVKVGQKDRITIKRSEKQVSIILLDDYDYYKVLRSKILKNTNECDGEMLWNQKDILKF